MADDDNGNNKSYESDSSTWDYGDQDTQIFDTQFCDSPTSSFGHKCDGDTDHLHPQQHTIPSDATDMCDDELATQLMDHDGQTQLMDHDGETQLMDHNGETQLTNLGGETQLVDLGGETQVVTLGGETQVVHFAAELEVMDMFDSDEKNDTQLFNDFDTEEAVGTDHEGTENTEIVDDSDEFSDEDSGRRDFATSGGLDHAQHRHHCKEYREESNLKTDCGRNEQHTSGVGFKMFTSVRAASMRASGLAALKKSSQRSKSPSCPTLSSEPDIEHRRILFRKGQSHAHEKHKLIDGPGTGSRCVFGRSTARKLFAEDAFAETKETDVNIDPPGEAEFAGLSYIDSQEPGDASQANALDFVDNFLKVNIECDNNKCDVSKSTICKSKPVLSAKGTQSFARSTNLINDFDKKGIFEWDDNFEDEGEIFRKYKETFFASGGQRLKSSVPSRSGRKLGQSDSKLVLGKRKENAKSRKSLGTHIKDLALRKNLINELDKQSTDMPGGIDIQETSEVRFDTQMAAEAMEDLCFGLQGTVHDFTKADGDCNHMPEGSHKNRAPSLSNAGVRTTRSKSKRSGDQSKEMKRPRAAAKKSVVCKETENLENVLSDVEKRREKLSDKRRKVVTVDDQVAPCDKISVKKQRIQNVTPISRTRQSNSDNESDQNLNPLTGFYPKGKRTSRKISSIRKEVGTQSIPRLTRSKAAILSKQDKGSIREMPNLSVCTTPVSRGTPVKEASPICMGDEYLKQSCRRPSLIQEVCSLLPTGSLITSPNKDTRHRRDVSLICVLFSRHLDGDIIKQQKKILSPLGASESFSMSDATHFIADDFVRTRNMLEAIALGKPVVTHLWLESCGQARCHIDEKNFLLRDAKKEKEFGFSLPTSLASARQNPLLKGHRVLITPNTKPGKEILSSLVKAVHGVAVERMGRSSLNDKIHKGLLILSCEEDYSVCLPFLEKGAAIYSSELLLNGIVTQRLEYQRHRLFLDHVKRTRSTIWLKKDDNQYKPVGKIK